MQRPAFELADIFRRHAASYRATHRLSYEQHRAIDAILACRSAALGGHVDQCDQCDHIRASYNSCRNRHCPKCQSAERAKWVQARCQELLPVPYFHVVFTVPEPIAAIAFHNRREVYNILFQSTAETLQRIARDRRHLGAEIGFFCVLHTWGQNLLHHPHLHCVVPGGGIASDGTWVSCRPGFFLPVKALSRLFRRLFLKLLRQSFEKRKLRFSGELEKLYEPACFQQYLAPLATSEWVVFAKPPFGGPRQAIDYLGRYTHRVALSNQRLLDVHDGQVTFQWKDYRHQGRDQSRRMTLGSDEFIRRFLLHVLPRGFQRIRFYGLLANRRRKKQLALCRELLRAAALEPLPDTYQTFRQTPPAESRDLCPRCGTGKMIRTLTLARGCQFPDTS